MSKKKNQEEDTGLIVIFLIAAVALIYVLSHAG